MLKVSILSIGDEICIGQVLNTNAQWIAEKCTEIGTEIVYHLSVGDNKERLIESLRYLEKSSDVIIMTGGLGPTSDDITKPILLEYFSDKLVFNNDVHLNIEEFFRKREREVSKLSLSQAEVPSKCQVIHNNLGTAPGMVFYENEKLYVSLPGVPYEMKEMVVNYVIPLLIKEIEKKHESVVKFKTFHTSGIPESNLAELIGDEREFLKEGETLAYLPSTKGVRLRIGVTGQDFSTCDKRLSEIEKILLNKISNFVLPIGNKELTETVCELLKGKKKTLAVAESCTGGMLGAEITSVSGASDFFVGGEITYSNWAKTVRLNVNEKTLQKYGAVSEQTACEMAENVRKIFNTDFGISITGIAGPTGGTPEKPVGTVWIGLSNKEKTFAKKFIFGWSRNINRERAVFTALNELKKVLVE
ncbi:MAG: competence/damage-inducible protein A [Bacteroidota bacterium]